MIERTSAELLISSWAIWGVGIVTVICRFASQRIRLGCFQKLQLDDYLMLLAAVAFTGVVVTSNQVALNGSNYADDDMLRKLPQNEKEKAEWGSKMLLALEEFMLATLWLVKACLLLLYARMTTGLKERLVVKLMAFYCAIGYLTIQILYLGVWCRPIYNYWTVPVPPGHDQCKSYHHHMITTTAIHVSSDLGMLCIPIPLIIRARLPFARKLVLCTVFGLGVSVVVVAILDRYYNFTQDESLVFLSWYNGEAATAVTIANIPFCWPLLQKIFSLRPWGGLKTHIEPLSRLPTIGSERGRGGSAKLRSTLTGMTVMPDESMEMFPLKESGQGSQ